MLSVNTIVIIVIVVIIIVLLIIAIYHYYKVYSKNNDKISFIKVPKHSLSTYGGFDWTIDSNLELYRPWNIINSRLGRTVGKNMMEYLGIYQSDGIKNININIDKVPFYYELDIYKYPSFDFYDSYPMMDNIDIVLPEGFYFICIRLAGKKEEIDANISIGIKTNIKMVNESIKKYIPTLLNEDIELFDTEVNKLIEEYNMRKYDAISVDIKPYTPNIRLYELTVEVQEGDQVLLIYPIRNNITSLTVNINNDMTYPEADVNEEMFSSVQYTIEKSSIINIKEFIYGIDENSILIPLRLYILEN